ncbi:hypothetical protein I316_07896 [Kwoniella heveanensis BCC8398]|uniref:Autophagy-related protein 11 n=1 Tax=Kwoniella heveanensis BCC8398 TaxID=1296120 RepID=A0A1B9GHE6_9TREE|nr:hypothetical protein I316_07896 [Kwoniella heveanensis BCC8398]
MDIYHASDGGLYQIDRQIEEYESLDVLYEDVGDATGISSGNVLLFLEDEREVKGDTFEELVNQAGPSSPSLDNRLKLYVFNRESFFCADAEQWAMQFQEGVSLPPELDPNQMCDLVQVQHPFIVAHDHLSHLQSFYQAQARALEIAYANLSHHLQPLVREFETFAETAEKELRSEEDLIRGAGLDMTLLPKLTINPALLKRKKDGEPEDKVKTIGDYVNRRKMEQVRDSCRTAHEEHVDRYNLITGQLNELHLQAEAETRGFNDHAAAVGIEFAEGLARLEVASNQLAELLGSGVVEDVYQDLIELDQAMREDLISLTGVKNDFTVEIHLHLRQVAQFQIRITQLVGPLRILENDLRDKSAFPHLHRLRQLPFAYATTVSEVVRRNEYARTLVEWTSRLSEALRNFTSIETKRREQVQTEMISQLPFSSIISDEANPRVNVSVVTGAEELGGIKWGEEEIEKLILWVEGLKEDRDVLAALEEGDEDHLEILQASIASLLGKVDFASEELDRLIERSVITSRGKVRSGSNSRTTILLSTQLHAANQEKLEQERRIAEMEEAHQATLRVLEEQHQDQLISTQQQLTAAQNRQGELQIELVRLRTDLGEEMMARQALSAELEVRSREQEDKLREHEDQADFIKGLQAELAQEKDRATDLGVRLQEALIDVDGLKSAEQSLISQLQELQEDRTRSLQTLGDAQLAVHNLESQLAGVRAELEATTQQLVEAQADRDLALKNQSAEAERLMRDHIAEADGDRAVLEHQNLTLTKQLEDIKVEMEEKLTAAKNASIRQADGLKAELSFTKAQLREVQRKETVLSDELAMAKDSATAMSQERSHQSDVSRDAVALASKYHETCQRLLNAINASTTISGTAGSQHVGIVRGKSPHKQPANPNPASNPISASGTLSTSSKDEMRESVLVRSLETAQGFDLVVFAEAVTRTIGLVKKWSKSCRQFRDAARNKISFSNFAKGDLALFLPTRNATARSWAAFNISAPHNFLKVNDAMQEQISTREWIIARIVKTDEAIATGGDSLETNPYGLADGLRYYTHHVEEYNPHAVRPPRRSTSTSYQTIKDPSGSVGQMLSSSTHRPTSASAGGIPIEPLTEVDSLLSPSAKTPMAMPGGGRGRSGSSYFPRFDNSVTSGLHDNAEISRGSTSDSPEPLSDAGQDLRPDSDHVIVDDEPPVRPHAPESASVGLAGDVPSAATADSVPLPGGTPASSPTVPAPPIPSSSIPFSANTTATSAQPIPLPQSSYRKTHSRFPSRGTPTSPPSRDHTYSRDKNTDKDKDKDGSHPSPALFARPSSVASSASSYPKVLTLGPSSGKSALAPATTTTVDSGHASPSLTALDKSEAQRTITRKQSSSTLGMSISPDGAGLGAGLASRPIFSPIGTSTGVGIGEKSRRGSKISAVRPDRPAPSSAGIGSGAPSQRAGDDDTASRSVSPTSASSPVPAAGTGASGGFAALGTGAGIGSIMRGFTIGRKTSAGMTSPPPNPFSSTILPEAETDVSPGNAGARRGSAGARRGSNDTSRPASAASAVGPRSKDTAKEKDADKGKPKGLWEDEDRRPSAMDILRRFESGG